MKEAQYRALTTPRPRASALVPADSSSPPPRLTSEARRNWQKAGKIALHAGHDDKDVDDSSASSESETLSQKQARRDKRMQEKQERIKSARLLDLQYFLEMVDLKHRYGSNLRMKMDPRSVTWPTDVACQARIMTSGSEATPTKTSFTGSITGKVRTLAHQLVRGSGWKGSKFGTSAEKNA